MTAINDLYAKTYYPLDQGDDLPVLVVMHGFGDGVSDMFAADLQRLALLGFVVVAVGMRGRDGASGSQDASGREIYDIYDAVEYVRANNSFASQTKAAIIGYSGGGGNALAAACKFPDYWTTVVDHFGISDYGRDGATGWYQNTSAGNKTTLEAWIGGTPVAVPNDYYARDATIAIKNFTGGTLYLYHDDQDTSVNVVQTTDIGDALDAAGLANYTEDITTTTDDPRWLHGYPSAHPGTLSTLEATWTAAIVAASVWTIPADGTVTVIGYIVTKRFTIWLNANGTATLGIDAAATVAYNTATDTYTVTPLVSGIDVTITQGAKTGSATNITEATEIVVT